MKDLSSRLQGYKFLNRNLSMKLLQVFLFFILFGLLFLSLREILPKEIDDVSPGIFCPMNYVKNSDVLWFIPLYENKTPSLEYCKILRDLDKEIGMHGIHHTYNEFYYPISEEELLEGIRIFKECVGYYPLRFKPPQLNISEENSKLVRKYLELEGWPNQVFHKVYHCEDLRYYPNNLIDWI